jgi:D-alanyl-D-alanine carboxypeptidase (penicillin-binding protein 5/6)
MFKILVRLTLAALCTAVTCAGAQTPNPAKNFAFSKAAKAYLVRVQGKDLWSAGDEQRLPPASLTKLMTALLVLEHYHPDDVVTISKAAAAEPPSKIGLHAGDRLRVADLLAAALIHSANDACHALADWRDGSEAKFVVRMNRRAKQMGLKNTHFANACGLDAPGHYSSARDIAVLADAAMNKPTFARLVRKQQMVVRTVDGRRRFSFRTTNALIGHYPGIMGGKTGFTNRAGPCLVALAERDGVRVLLVLMNSHNRWWNASGMLDLAFAQASRG